MRFLQIDADLQVGLVGRFAIDAELRSNYIELPSEEFELMLEMYASY